MCDRVNRACCGGWLVACIFLSLLTLFGIHGLWNNEYDDLSRICRLWFWVVAQQLDGAISLTCFLLHTPKCSHASTHIKPDRLTLYPEAFQTMLLTHRGFLSRLIGIQHFFVYAHLCVSAWLRVWGCVHTFIHLMASTFEIRCIKPSVSSFCFSSVEDLWLKRGT